MKKTKWLAIAAAGFLVGAPMLEAEAKRLGGGGNIGRVAPSQGAKPGTIPAKPAQPLSLLSLLKPHLPPGRMAGVVVVDVPRSSRGVASRWKKRRKKGPFTSLLDLPSLSCRPWRRR